MKTKIIICSILFVAFCVALYFRIVPNYSYVFPEGWVRFLGTDSWYHIEIIQNLVKHFPMIPRNDSLLLYPNPMVMSNQNFFDYLVAGIILILTLGKATQNQVYVISAFIPPILGVLTMIPVYFIGKTIFNKWVGLISAVLTVFMSSEFLGRSEIGYVDHHVLEVLLLVTTVLFFVLALKSNTKKRVIYGIVSGFILALYLNTWIGSLLLVFIIFIFAIVQFIIEYAKKTSELAYFLIPMFAVCFIFTILLPHVDIQLYTIALSILVFMLLFGIKSLFQKYKIGTWYYLLSVVGIGVISILVVYFVKPEILQTIAYQFGVLVPQGTRLTIEEARGIFFPWGYFTPEIYWTMFTMSGILFLAGFGLLIKKNIEPDKLFLLIWTFVIVVLTIFMRRFTYYMTINVAILTAYVSYLSGKYFWTVRKKVKVRTKKPKIEIKDAPTPRKVFGCVLVFMVVLFPSIYYTNSVVNVPQFSPSNAWHEAMDWVKDNTSNDAIIAQWDYGYWITVMGNRPPYINPGVIDGRDRVSKFFLSQSENTTLKPKYVLLTYETALPSFKYWSFNQYAGIPNSFGYFTQSDKSQVLLYDADYYKTLAVRLYNFDCKPVFEGQVYVAQTNGTQILQAKEMSSYSEAQSFIKGKSNWTIVSTDPMVSIVTEQPIRDYRLVFSSTNRINGVPEIKIFERVSE